MTALLDDADLRIIEVDVLLLERWLSKTQLETLAEQRLLLAARQMRALIDHIKSLTDERDRLAKQASHNYTRGLQEGHFAGSCDARDATLSNAEGYVLTAYEDAYPGDDAAEAQLVLTTPHIYPTIESAQTAAQVFLRVSTQPVFALVPVVT